MQTKTKYSQAIGVMQQLDDQELRLFLTVVEAEIAARKHMATYNAANDPFVREDEPLLGSPDLAERVEDILYGDSDKTTQADE